MTDLPPLPEFDSLNQAGLTYAQALQVFNLAREYGRLCYAAGMERAAQIAESAADDYRDAGEAIRAAIRQGKPAG